MSSYDRIIVMLLLMVFGGTVHGHGEGIILSLNLYCRRTPPQVICVGLSLSICTRSQGLPAISKPCIESSCSCPIPISTDMF